MMRALERHCGELVPLGPLPSRMLLVGKMLSRLSQLTLGRRIDCDHVPIVAKQFGGAIGRRIEGRALDLLFFPNGSEVLAYLKGTDLPAVYFSDATFKRMVGYYNYYSNLLGISERWGNEIEGRAIARADLLLYPSRWVAESALQHYGASADKIHIILCGGNIEAKDVPSREEILSWRKEDNAVLEILYIGSDWKRKGGDIALAAMEELNRRGTDCRLTVCGGGSPKLAGNNRVEYIGFLDPNSEEDRKRFRDLYRKASVLVLPTRSECFSFVFAEASAFGLPVVGTATGGVVDYVDHGKGGYLLPREEGYASYADRIEDIWNNKQRYRLFSAESKSKYELELNWDAWALKVRDLLATVL